MGEEERQRGEEISLAAIIQAVELVWSAAYGRSLPARLLETI
jgi:hypothetical protein